MERVKFHLANLEVCLRLITNEKLDAKEMLSRLKEQLEMYIDALDPENEDEDDPENYDSSLGGWLVGFWGTVRFLPRTRVVRGQFSGQQVADNYGQLKAIFFKILVIFSKL